MKKVILSTLILGGLLLAIPAQAQLLKKIQNAAANAATNAATNKANEKAEKAGNNALEGMMGGMMEPATTESEYSFTGFMVMEVTSTDKKGKSEEPVRINYLLSQEPEFMGMNFQDPKKPENTTTTIMDTKNEAMVMLMSSDGQKSSFAIKMDYEKVQELVDEEAEEQLENPEYKLTKTGNTKTILGYDCEEWLVVSEDGEGRYWITEKPIDGLSIFSPQSNPMVSNKTMERYTSMFSNAPKGSFMEMIFTDTDGTVTDMKVIEIDTNSPKKYSMTEYPNMLSGGGN
ncbi:DUF4412 domain-containing protein [Algoriphagus litoralis]|uniref:DUF4412 domain-containing protein n=1 Tax=Algoriphagus litoralis TaxID=2202829 RepID=UPI000DBA2E3D|nr:DUF4412 domain-containing protein [Algoriphagus litoralis]